MRRRFAAGPPTPAVFIAAASPFWIANERNERIEILVILCVRGCRLSGASRAILANSKNSPIITFCLAF